MPRNLSSSAFMKPFVVLALPGMYLFYKYNQYKRQQQEQNRRKVTERELAHLNHKIDKLLTKLDENEPEVATSQEDECVICVNAKATMQTSPCGHRVVCRKCFVKTIQMAVSQRLLPLRCVICRAKILRLKHTSSAWLVPPSASHYSFSSSASAHSAHSVPNSESLYSMTSGSSSFSGVSTVSSATNSSAGSGIGLDKNFRSKIQYPRQPTSGAFRRSQTQAMKYRLQEYKEPLRPDCQEKVPNRLPPIQEFQREFRAGKERSASTSTRIRCAQKIVTQLETSAHPSNTSYSSSSSSNHASSSASSSSNYFRSALKTPNKDLDKKKCTVEIVPTKKNSNSNQVKKKDDSSRPTSASSSCNSSNNIKTSDNNKKKANDEPVKVIIEEKGNKKSVDKRDKKEEKKESKKDSKDDTKSKEKKELTKAEKKELKKEAKAEKKAAKKEAKNESKKEKAEKKE
ncbi:serine-rich adhesin for platelets [Nilaparvata lugens]|uniref:serine-rich adhesin for platelets n=1 Tax=Nilaparvata lugens TaxID=108931 RepID=UPI00193DD763|nr:serine-rich adhesin for platelets [Nilaparvata lugens]